MLLQGKGTSSASRNQSVEALSLLHAPKILHSPTAVAKQHMGPGQGRPSPTAPFAEGQHPLLGSPGVPWEPRLGRSQKHGGIRDGRGEPVGSTLRLPWYGQGLGQQPERHCRRFNFSSNQSEELYNLSP